MELMTTTNLTPIEVALQIDEEGRTTVKKLYEWLELDKSNYSKWFRNNITENIFASEHEDYEVFVPNDENLNGGRPTVDAKITAKLAKKLCMKAPGKKGEMAREYFTKVEDALKETIRKKKPTYTFNAEDYTKAILAVADNFKTDQAGKINMLKKGYEATGIPDDFLPEYSTDNNDKIAFSATDLLNKNNCALSVKQFNKAMLAFGFLETKTRPSSKGGVKEFKALTDKGLVYGKNAVSHHNIKEVQPLYWEDTFMELYKVISEEN